MKASIQSFQLFSQKLSFAIYFCNCYIFILLFLHAFFFIKALFTNMATSDSQFKQPSAARVSFYNSEQTMILDRLADRHIYVQTKKHLLKSVHCKKTVVRILFLSKLWCGTFKSKLKVPQF